MNPSRKSAFHPRIAQYLDEDALEYELAREYAQEQSPPDDDELIRDPAEARGK